MGFWQPMFGMNAQPTSTQFIHRSERFRPVQAYVDRAAIKHNLAQIKRHLYDRALTPRVWATVKCDAYGHGIAGIIDSLGAADGLAVSHLGEAHACKRAGWAGPILVYAGVLSPDQLEGLDVPELHLCVNRPEQLRWIERADLTHPPTVWLRFAGDIRHYGMDEQLYKASYRIAKELLAKGKVLAIGHMNHFANAADRTSVIEASRTFRALIDVMPGSVSTHNSAALLEYADAVPCGDWVRPGLALYGASPLPGRPAAHFGLRPAMTLCSELVGVRHLNAGETVGYGGKFAAPNAMRIGLVSCGYGDGYPRLAPCGTPIVVGGVATRVIGGITMDMLTVDLTPVPTADLGTPVTLWGSDRLPVDCVADAIGTIAAELFTGLTTRVPLTYLS